MKKIFGILTIFSAVFLMAAESFANNDEFFYQRCQKDGFGRLKCVPVQGIPTMKYKKVFLKDLRAGQCYRRNSDSNKIIFYKILQIKKQTIFALAQAVPADDLKNFDDKIFVDHYPWNGDNFNQDIQEFPCSETPTLSDNNYLRQRCKYTPGETRRRTLYCDPVLKNRSYERSF